MMKVSLDLKWHDMILQSPVTGFLSQVKALFFILKLEELNSVFAMSSVYICQSLSKPELQVLFGGRRAKEGKDVLFLGVGKEASQRNKDPASPFS